MEGIELLSSIERNLFVYTLPNLRRNKEFFVIRFYYYFLKTKAGLLFQQTTIRRQYLMINDCITVITSYITDSDILEDRLLELNKKDKYLFILLENVEYFIDSFMKALKEVFYPESDEILFKCWNKVIFNIITSIKNKIN